MIFIIRMRGFFLIVASSLEVGIVEKGSEDRWVQVKITWIYRRRKESTEIDFGVYF